LSVEVTNVDLAGVLAYSSKESLIG